VNHLINKAVVKSPLWSTDFDENEPDLCGDGFGVFGNFRLVGHGPVTNDRCGKYLSLFGCLDEESHSHLGLDLVDYSKKAYVRAVRCSCNRPSCPLCFKSWAVRSAKVIAAKLFEASKTRGKVEHVIVSVPPKDYGLPFRVLRKKVIAVAKSRGVLGGTLIFHALRYDPCRHWYAGLHWHILGFVRGGYGRCRSCRQQYCSQCNGFEGDVFRGQLKDGYVVKVASAGEERKSIFGTAVYELGHATYDDSMKNFRIVVWFGSCSSRQLKGVKVELPHAVCGICGAELRRVMYTGRNVNLVDMKREVANSKGSFEFVSDLYENGELVWSYCVRRFPWWSEEE
jgi:hypothetical protein